MNNITKRAISGIIYVSIISLCLLIGNWAAFSLFLILTFLCLWEYKTLLLPEQSLLQKILFISCGLYLFCVLSLWHYSPFIPTIYFGFGLLLTVLVFIIQLFHKHKSPFDIIGRQLAGWIYIPFSMGCFMALVIKNIYIYQEKLVF